MKSDSEGSATNRRTVGATPDAVKIGQDTGFWNFRIGKTYSKHHNRMDNKREKQRKSQAIAGADPGIKRW